MKNLFFSFFAIAIIALTTSCQKEDVLPQPENETPGILAIPPSGTPAEEWNLCEEDMRFFRWESDSGMRLLSIFDSHSEWLLEAREITSDGCPAPVRAAAEEFFPEMEISAYWESISPAGDHYLLELDFEKGVTFGLLVDAEGKVKCQGYRY